MVFVNLLFSFVEGIEDLFMILLTSDIVVETSIGSISDLTIRSPWILISVNFALTIQEKISIMFQFFSRILVPWGPEMLNDRQHFQIHLGWHFFISIHKRQQKFRCQKLFLLITQRSVIKVDNEKFLIELIAHDYFLYWVWSVRSAIIFLARSPSAS